MTRQELLDLWIEYDGLCKVAVCDPSSCIYKRETKNAPCLSNYIRDWAVKERGNKQGSCESIWD